MTVLELRQKHASLLDEAEGLLNKEDRSQEDMDKANALVEEAKGIKGELDTRDAISASRIADPPGPTIPPATPTITVAEPEKRFNSFGEQLRAIMDASRPGGYVDPRLVQERAIDGMSEKVPSDGGFLVQTDYATTILTKAHDIGKLWPGANDIPLGANSDSLEIPAVDESDRATGSRWGGIQMYWVDEGDSVTAKKPKFRKIRLNLHRLMGMAYLTNDLIKDTTAMDAILTKAFGEEVAFMLDDALIRGTGAGQPLGVLNAACVVSVTKEAGQPADTVAAENVMKMYSRCWGRENAAWFYNSEIETQLWSMSIAVGTGGVPIYMPANGLSQSPYGTLFGRPAVPLEQASAIGDVGDICLLNLNEYITISKGGIETAYSIHLKFDYDEMAFRIIYRTDGQPGWNKVLTPYKGSANATKSPFVVLGAR